VTSFALWVVGVIVFATHRQFLAVVHIPGTMTLRASTTFAVLAFAGGVAAFLGREKEVVGLVSGGLVAWATAAWWLLLTGRHAFAGRVVYLVSAGHGIHLGDVFAAVPFAFGGWLMVRAALIIRADRTA
jgi:hypothetical protein